MSSNTTDLSWNFDNSYLSLPPQSFSKQAPTQVQKPEMVIWNSDLAQTLGLDFIDPESKETAAIFAGNQLPKGAAPIAQAYAGHQFGHFTMLGDGRAILLGEQITPDNKRYDIQLKGSGQTPYSRRGDGRATLYSMLREYLISEAMFALGIPTTRSLAVVKTGEEVQREIPHEGAVLTRIAGSHIRVGTFEFFRNYLNIEDLQQLLQYVISRHYPDLKESQNPALDFLTAVMHKQIKLVVEWMRVGFIHGVMNTDNMSIPGETIDYGPCAFMNAYSPTTVFSSIDHQGRYAFGRQPNMAHWNLGVLAGALLPLIDEHEEQAIGKAKEVLNQFPQHFREAWYPMMYKKIGLVDPNPDDQNLVDELLQLMQKHEADYTNLFVALQNDVDAPMSIFQSIKFQAWREKWKSRIQDEGTWTEGLKLMRSQNPVVIPRNHLVEIALVTAVQQNDFKPFDDLLSTLSHPYQEEGSLPKFQAVPEGHDMAYQTFCGT